MTEGEKAGLVALKAELTDSIKKGVDFANKGEDSIPPSRNPSQPSLPDPDKNQGIQIQAALDEMPSGGALIGEQLGRDTQPKPSGNPGARKSASSGLGGVPPGGKSGVPTKAEETTGVYYAPPAEKVREAKARARAGKGTPGPESPQPAPSDSTPPSDASETTGGLYMPRNKKLPGRSSGSRSEGGQREGGRGVDTVGTGSSSNLGGAPPGGIKPSMVGAVEAGAHAKPDSEKDAERSSTQSSEPPSQAEETTGGLYAPANKNVPQKVEQGVGHVKKAGAGVGKKPAAASKL